MAYDLIATALAICAAEGNAAACLVMSHVLRKVPRAGRAEARIATSWLTYPLREVLSREVLSRQEKKTASAEGTGVV